MVKNGFSDNKLTGKGYERVGCRRMVSDGSEHSNGKP